MSFKKWQKLMAAKIVNAVFCAVSFGMSVGTVLTHTPLGKPRLQKFPQMQMRAWTTRPGSEADEVGLAQHIQPDGVPLRKDEREHNARATRIHVLNMRRGDVGIHTRRAPVFDELLGGILPAGHVRRAIPQFVGALIILLLEPGDELLDDTLLAPSAEREIQDAQDGDRSQTPEDETLRAALPPLIADAVSIQVPGHPTSPDRPCRNRRSLRR